MVVHGSKVIKQCHNQESCQNDRSSEYTKGMFFLNNIFTPDIICIMLFSAHAIENQIVQKYFTIQYLKKNVF